jgi:TonB family protein
VIEIRHMPPWMLAACAIQLLLFLGCAAAILVLRLLRRGGARFAAAPAVVALLLLPVAFACAATAYALRGVLAGLALVGSGGIAAISAGLAEALISLLLGFASSSLLAVLGWIALAAGTSGVKPGTASTAPGAGPGGPVASFVVMGLTGGLVVFLWSLVNQASRLKMDPALAPYLPVVLGGAVLLFVLLAAIVIVGALKAARGRTPIPIALASLALVTLLGIGSLGGVWVVYRRISCFSEAAATGAPCGELRDPDALPEVAIGPPATDPPEEPPPPPPPPSPTPLPALRAERRATERPAAAKPVRQEEAPPARTMAPVRVGGAIREPRRIKNVTPLYPDIAKQARVQGIVILECTIGPRGNVTEVKVLRGIPLLDEAAVDAVRQWVYAPTLLNGVPVPVIMTVTVNFKLS